MRQRGAGRILNVASILGRFALPGSGLYAASKFALEAASDALRMELAPFGVQVLLVEPGGIATPLYQRAAAALPDDQALGPYQTSWPAGLGFPQRPLRAAASVDTIAATLADAALAPRPPARDRPGLRNRLTTRLLTTLPTRASDRIKRRIAGLAPSAPRPHPAPDGATPPSRAAAPTRRAPTPRGRRVNRCGDRTAPPSTLVSHPGPDADHRATSPVRAAPAPSPEPGREAGLSSR